MQQPVLPIVELSTTNVPADVAALFARLRPGAVAVVWAHAQGLLIFYEGGRYSRGTKRPPTAAERDEYACIAAKRAVQGGPGSTTAFFALSGWAGLQVVGYVDTESGVVRWGGTTCADCIPPAKRPPWATRGCIACFVVRGEM